MRTRIADKNEPLPEEVPIPKTKGNPKVYIILQECSDGGDSHFITVKRTLQEANQYIIENDYDYYIEEYEI